MCLPISARALTSGVAASSPSSPKRGRRCAVNPRTWINQTDYRELEFRPSLQAFATQRTDLLGLLGSLAPEDLERAATVTGAGKVLERSVLFYARWLAEHERPHVKQVARIVNSMRKERCPPQA